MITPKIKVSENAAKITNPGFKKIYRLYSNETGKAEADLLMLRDESIDEDAPLEIFDPEYTWKRRVIENYTARELLVSQGGLMLHASFWFPYSKTESLCIIFPCLTRFATTAHVSLLQCGRKSCVSRILTNTTSTSRRSCGISSTT